MSAMIYAWGQFLDHDLDLTPSASPAQPFNVAEVFTGKPGKYVKLADTIRGFKEILDGKHDGVSEQNFYMKGAIEEIQETQE